jgi:hypothetical protein
MINEKSDYFNYDNFEITAKQALQNICQEASIFLLLT